MNFYIRNFLLSTLTLAISQIAVAEVSMTNIAPMQIPEQGTEIRVMFNGIPPEPKAYQLDNPPRLLLDFEQVKQSISKNNIVVSSPEASTIDLASDPQRARMTVNLKNKDSSFSTRVEGNTFILKISNNKNLATSTWAPTSTPQKQGVSNIAFKRGNADEGQISLELLDSKTPIDIQQQGGKIVIRVLGAKLPTHLNRRMDVNDFATPVTTIDSYNEGSNGVITVQTNGSYEYMAFQTGNKMTVSFKRPSDQSKVKSRTPIYTGKKISLDFQDIEVRRVLQLLAEFTGINMVASDSVQGNMTLRMQDVPWDQALDIILKTKNLDQRRNGNVIWIAPLPEMIKSEEEQAKAIAQSVKLAPIQTEYIQLKYAKVTDIEKLISKGSSNLSSNRTSTDVTQEMDGTMLSPRGTLSIDPRTNTLILNDTAQKIDQIRKMVDLLDVSIKQVMIEARIVRATTDFTKEMGVKWGILSQGITKNSNLLVGGSDTTLWDLRNPKKDTDTGAWKYEITRPDNLNVDLGVSSAGASKIAFGLISLSDFMLDLELSALQADGFAEIISTPKVMTADKQNAKVASGQEIPYQTTTTSGSGSTVNTSFKDALLSLDVTPSITPDGKVQMQLKITNDSNAGTAPNGEIVLNKNQIDTNVLVGDGETVVLGGIFEQNTVNKQTKVPLLGDIPVLGHLFRKDVKSENKSELLIFVTPRIVNDR